jgi:hypothetical protein
MMLVCSTSVVMYIIQNLHRRRHHPPGGVSHDEWRATTRCLFLFFFSLLHVHVVSCLVGIGAVVVVVALVHPASVTALACAQCHVTGTDHVILVAGQSRQQSTLGCRWKVPIRCAKLTFQTQ